MRFSSYIPTLFRILLITTILFASRIKLHGETTLYHEVYNTFTIHPH